MALSPLNQRRIANFKANKRGYYALWLFLVLFIFSLFAEFWANDKPLLVSYKNNYYTPIFKDYPETTFGDGRLTGLSSPCRPDRGRDHRPPELPSSPGSR